MYTANTKSFTLSLHDALPISVRGLSRRARRGARHRPLGGFAADRLQGHAHRFAIAHPRSTVRARLDAGGAAARVVSRSEEHTSELQSRLHLVCRLLPEKKKHK